MFHDELDLAEGKIRVKHGGGHAGHNGLRSCTPTWGQTTAGFGWASATLAIRIGFLDMSSRISRRRMRHGLRRCWMRLPTTFRISSRVMGRPS